ncbi:MAG: hypothetical protein K0R51_2563 [Cytophagaceae bacterium]|jgi:hypothetical protein|nr:hypothetical protein [Cytophagaceae bacterium]
MLLNINLFSIMGILFLSLSALIHQIIDDVTYLLIVALVLRQKFKVRFSNRDIFFCEITFASF